MPVETTRVIAFDYKYKDRIGERLVSSNNQLEVVIYIILGVELKFKLLKLKYLIANNNNNEN